MNLNSLVFNQVACMVNYYLSSNLIIFNLDLENKKKKRQFNQNLVNLGK